MPILRPWSRPRRFGVVVFDPQPGRPVSFNREARRIVQGLSGSGGDAEHWMCTRPGPTAMTVLGGARHQPVHGGLSSEKAWSRRREAGCGSHASHFAKRTRTACAACAFAEDMDVAANPTYIFNPRGVGYRMPEPERDGAA